MTSGNRLATGNSPFKICQFCSREFGSLSLAIHQKTCRQKCTDYVVSAGKSVRNGQNLSLPRQRTKNPRQQVVGKNEFQPARKLTTSVRSGTQSSRQLLASIRDSGRAQEPRAPRPKTAIKSRSSLLASGYEVPVITDEQCASTEHGVVCITCGESVPSFKYDVHRRTCFSAKNHVSTGSIVFPRTGEMRTSGDTKAQQQTVPVRKTPTHVTCSICGLKYGTKSIAIHQPQCIKKRQLERRRLPAPDGPLPVAALMNPRAGEESRQIRPRSDADKAEAYFQYCYAEFEKELLPCGKCKRSFAPERHKKHILNCNAKPLMTARR